ncbi:MAG: M1 family metallopeptidase [Pyrinomonadaceae bacterium]
MLVRLLLIFLLIPAPFVLSQESSSNNYKSREDVEFPTRTIRRDIPLTNAIKRAYKDGTRDFSGKPGPNYWQLKTDYTISAKLNTENQKIYGSEKIILHNTSNDELTQILLRLDHNIYRPFVPRGSSVPAETTEGMVITKLIVGGDDVDLSGRFQPPQLRQRGAEPLPPELGVTGLDQTVAVIYLEKPVKPHSDIELVVEWNTKLPGGPNGRAHRMTQRWDDRLFQPTQWYPRIAKYDDLQGWETNVYLGPSEFYNNFGRFDVKIEVPGGWIVSGTGVLQNPETVLTPKAREQLSKVLDSDEEITIVGPDETGRGKATANADKLEWHFVAENVNDFAWATARDFVWKSTRATIPGKGPIPIHMVFLPERARFFAEAGKRTRHALEFYSKLWAPYPFPQLTLQDGPSAGMEYPMVINSNQGAADHETGHQWWPMMVGNNETRYGWMDEGFNQYMNILSRADVSGSPPMLDGLGQIYGRISGTEDEPPMMWNANYGGPFYGFQTYGKTPFMLSMLGGIVGDERVQAGIRGYTKEWSFKHPSPWDFMFYMNNALGQDLEWFWYYWLFTTDSVNGSIKSVVEKGGKTSVTIHQAGQMPSPVVIEVEFEETGAAIKPMPNAVMKDPNKAVVSWPVDVWFTGQRDFVATLDFGKRKIKKITFDPSNRFPDNDPSDNVWPKEK